MSRRLAPVVMAVLTVVGASACEEGGDGSPSSPAPSGEPTCNPSEPSSAGEEAGAGETVAPGRCGLPPGAVEEPEEPEEPLFDTSQCLEVGFPVANASFEEKDGFLQYAALSSPGQGFDWLKVRVALSPDSPVEPGAYDLADEVPGDCGVCVTVDGDCTVGGGKVNCAGHFAAESGVVEIESIPGPSTPLPQGGGVLPKATVPAEPTCVPEGTGVVVGSNIGDFALTNCFGDPVPLHAACEDGSKATWLFGTAGWCGACAQTLYELGQALGGEITPESIQANWGPATGMPQIQDAALDFRIILIEDDLYQAPTPEYCLKYAAQHALDPERVLMDPGYSFRGTVNEAVLRDEASGDAWCLDGFTFEGLAPKGIPLAYPPGYEVAVKGFATTWTFMNPYMVADRSGMVASSTPWYAVLRSTNMEYVWSSWWDQNANPIALINELLLE